MLMAMTQKDLAYENANQKCVEGFRGNFVCISICLPSFAENIALAGTYGNYMQAGCQSDTKQYQLYLSQHLWRLGYQPILFDELWPGNGPG